MESASVRLWIKKVWPTETSHGIFISLRFSNNSEANASELLENHEERLTLSWSMLTVSIEILMTDYEVTCSWPTSSLFSSNSEPSESLENIEEMFPWYYMDGDVISSPNLQSHTDVLPVTKGF